MEIVESASRLKEVVASALKQPRVAIDLESNGFHRYPERVCLVQLAAADGIYLIDPLVVDDVSPLGDLLAAPSVEKIFHSADYDIRSLDRDWSFRVSPLFDTGIAAAFMGHSSLGLAALLKECLNVEVSKAKRLQRADWTVRPISPELRTYAAEDVRHLNRLAALLRENLDELGRTEWVKEECERLSNVRYAPPNSENAFLSVKGSKGLDGRGLAILRSLHSFREREAIRRDRPPFKIFSNATMLALAASPQSDLRAVKGIGRYAFGRDASNLRNSLRRGMDAPPVERHERQKLVSSGRARISAKERQTARKRLGVLKRWRAEQARNLGLSAGMVWSAASLERIAHDNARFDDEMASSSVRKWQRREFAPSLFEVVKRM